MSYDEAMIDDIKADLDHLDVEALRSIREIIARSKRQTATAPHDNGDSASNLIDEVAVAPKPLAFVGENLTLEEFERLSMQERALLQRRLREQNQRWLQEKFEELGVAWLAVVDGKIIASGKTRKTKPLPPQTLEISQRTGKFPFIFANDKLMVIEEGVTAWQTTTQPGDYYPSFQLKIGSDAAFEVIGDLDTGSTHTFFDYDSLIAQNIIRPEARDYLEIHHHLNRPFVYVDKLVRIELPAAPDETRFLETLICCVQDWQTSPFVKINPNRTALIGRDIMLELKPRVLLDFDKRQTEIVTAKKPRKKIAPKKKSAAPKRRRA